MVFIYFFFISHSADPLRRSLALAFIIHHVPQHYNVCVHNKKNRSENVTRRARRKQFVSTAARLSGGRYVARRRESAVLRLRGEFQLRRNNGGGTNTRAVFIRRRRSLRCSSVIQYDKKKCNRK